MTSNSSSRTLSASSPRVFSAVARASVVAIALLFGACGGLDPAALDSAAFADELHAVASFLRDNGVEPDDLPRDGDDQEGAQEPRADGSGGQTRGPGDPCDEVETLCGAVDGVCADLEVPEGAECARGSEGGELACLAEECADAGERCARLEATCEGPSEPSR